MITIDPPSSASSNSPALSKASLTRYLRRAQEAVALPGEVSVLLTNNAAIRRLNRSYRGKNKATDVLSFPAAPIPGLPAEFQHAGDIAISLDVALQQAERFGHTLLLEVKVLVLHGLLHLAGFDHETDAGEMAAREGELRRELRLPVGLIGRVTRPVATAPTSRTVTRVARR